MARHGRCGRCLCRENSHLLSPELAFSVACRASCAALVVGFLEQFKVFDSLYGTAGPSSPAVGRAMASMHFPAFLVGSNQAYLRGVILLGACAGTVVAVLGPYYGVGQVALAVTFGCVVVIRVRRITGGDGAEQMAILTLFAAIVTILPGLDHGMVVFSVWFLGGQTVLSYATAGIAKALAPIWRDGKAIPLILGSEAYGQPWASAILGGYPSVGQFLTRAVVVFECAFPLILVAPRSVAIAMLTTGALFHIGCAVTMGLNAFLLVFPGSYLCVLYIAQRTSPFW
jgi:hypothetical protein